MKAMIQNEYGAPLDVLALEEIDKPTVGDDEVRVEVRAAGVHIGEIGRASCRERV